jgi:hypothetical protein
MSHNNSNSSEHLLLINILNTMYNDNLTQIQNLNNSNNEIRNLITNILLNRRSTTNNRATNRNNNSARTYASYNPNNNSNRNLFNRIYLNNTPYLMNSFQEYIIQNPEISLPYRQTSTSRNEERITNLLQSFFEPVQIYPTQSQIENATRRVRYCDIVSPRNRACPISLDTFEDTNIVSVIRYCGHIFNTEELNTWFTTNCRCPVCRYDIRNYRPNNRSDNFINETNTTDTINSVNSSSSIPETQENNFVINEEERNDNFYSIYDSSGNSIAYLSDALSIMNLLTNLQTQTP